MQEDVIIVKRQEEKRALALNRVLAGEWTMGEAAEAVGLSVRQLRRLKGAYEEGGIRALVHGNRGRPSPFALAPTTRQRGLELAPGRDSGGNGTAFTRMR